ncbi:DUF3703 domain-containing protein [Pseudomonas sp. PDM14]|uniref:DUF3703 domain-containing protein n=1 Tax=Pseudomonas sp. PDM14 TaxID=2769288 RepID=UPI00177D4322|nr:DUF3703 domain-containing protein [Pseudomonas sp. PDM14]MBD9485325.1 DUF3703 domain-containing protein [Pseudomonas sp. PDM14]
MADVLHLAIDQAFSDARQALAQRQWPAAYASLERAHILSQRLPLLHLHSHWLMLQVGWRCRDWREVLGQAPRMLAALLFSRLWVPLGNTGRARVSAFRPMPISAELQRLLR